MTLWSTTGCFKRRGGLGGETGRGCPKSVRSRSKKAEKANRLWVITIYSSFTLENFESETTINRHRLKSKNRKKRARGIRITEKAKSRRKTFFDRNWRIPNRAKYRKRLSGEILTLELDGRVRSAGEPFWKALGICGKMLPAPLQSLTLSIHCQQISFLKKI